MQSRADKPIKILLVEDSEDDAKLTLRALRQGGVDAAHQRVDSAAAMQAALERETWDAVISDYSMPGFTGLDALRIFNRAGLDIPFILVSGAVGEEIAVEAMRCGAGDYVMKRDLARLAPALARELQDSADRAAHRRAAHELEQFRLAMDVSGDSIYLTDAATLRFVYLNNAACRWLGHSRDELLQMGPQDVLGVDREQMCREFDEAIAAGERGTTVEHRYRRHDGGEGWTEVHRRALGTNGGTRIVSIGRDTTERKQADAHIRRLNRLYAVLSGVNSAIVRIRDRAELFREVCRIVMRAGGLAFAYIAVADAAEQRLKPFDVSGGDADFLERVMSRLSLRDDAPEGHGPAATAVREKRPVVVNDVENDPQIRYKKEHAQRGIRSVALLPLFVGGEPAGVLGLHASETGFFDDAEMKLLTELAGDVAFAMENIEKQEKLDYLAFYDQITGLANRALFLDRVAQHMRSAASGGHTLALFLFDLERFKNINDSLGQPAGDALLRQVAEWLMRDLGDASLLARVGADQFAAVLPQVMQQGNMARLLKKKMKALMKHPFGLNGAEFRIGAKVGVALYPDDGADAGTLFKNAEAALKKAKASGERYLFYTQKMTDAVAGRLTLETQLRQALEKDEFVLHYQPKVDLESRRITGVEALIRWQSPELGLVPPAKFIPLMEETGLIVEVGAWALARAVADHARWLDLGIAAPRVAVNVSALQLRRRDFVATLDQVLKRGTMPTGIDLEITESLIMEDVQGTIEKLKAAREIGVRIAIDDFGTGYSSLAYLARLPVHTLKIDRSFVITMLADMDTMTLVSTMISLAHSLRLKVVAEGVDAEEQADALRRMGCDEMQGYLFSRPVPFEQMTALLTRE